MKFALIKNGMVQNIIVADQNFIDGISHDYDQCMRVDQMFPYPGPGWSYVDGVFSAPEVIEEEVPVE